MKFDATQLDKAVKISLLLIFSILAISSHAADFADIEASSSKIGYKLDMLLELEPSFVQEAFTRYESDSDPAFEFAGKAIYLPSVGPDELQPLYQKALDEDPRYSVLQPLLKLSVARAGDISAIKDLAEFEHDTSIQVLRFLPKSTASKLVQIAKDEETPLFSRIAVLKALILLGNEWATEFVISKDFEDLVRAEGLPYDNVLYAVSNISTKDQSISEIREVFKAEGYEASVFQEARENLEGPIGKIEWDEGINFIAASSDEVGHKIDKLSAIDDSVNKRFFQTFKPDDSAAELAFALLGKAKYVPETTKAELQGLYDRLIALNPDYSQLEEILSVPAARKGDEAAIKEVMMFQSRNGVPVIPWVVSGNGKKVLQEIAQSEVYDLRIRVSALTSLNALGDPFALEYLLSSEFEDEFKAPQARLSYGQAVEAVTGIPQVMKHESRSELKQKLTDQGMNAADFQTGRSKLKKPVYE